jgi:hypothetical protein
MESVSQRQSLIDKSHMFNKHKIQEVNEVLNCETGKQQEKKVDRDRTRNAFKEIPFHLLLYLHIKNAM